MTLDRGVTVLMFTDGLIERRDADIDDGMERLVAALADLADLPLQEICDRVLERMVEGQPDDDVALVAVRLHRQDLPRPAEAGPRNLPATGPARARRALTLRPREDAPTGSGGRVTVFTGRARHEGGTT